MDPARIAVEVAHHIALIPVLAVLKVRQVPPAYRWVAFAFAVSWVADSAIYFGDGTWMLDYWWVPVQMGLALMAFVRSWRWLWALVLVSMASWLFLGPPDWALRVIGSVVVLAYARGPLRWPLWIYFGAGTLAYVAMVATLSMSVGYAYHAVRLLGYLAFVAVVLHYRREHVGDTTGIGHRVRAHQ